MLVAADNVLYRNGHVPLPSLMDTETDKNANARRHLSVVRIDEC